MALHRKLSLAYLGNFSRSFPDQETIDEWVSMWGESLGGLDGEQVKHGLLYCQKNHPFPPTVGEFRAACEAKPKPHVAPPQHQGVGSAEGIKRVASIMSGLKNRPIDGRAYWRKIIDDPTTSAYTRQFAHEAMANLDDPRRGLAA